MKVESSKANWMPSIALTFTQRVEITKIDLVLTTDATQKAKSAGIKVPLNISSIMLALLILRSVLLATSPGTELSVTHTGESQYTFSSFFVKFVKSMRMTHLRYPFFSNSILLLQVTGDFVLFSTAATTLT